MSTVSELLGVPRTRVIKKHTEGFASPCYMGLEVEIEGYDILQSYLGDWNIVRDGSLREEGAEFVLSSPLCGERLLTAISVLSEHLGERGYNTSHRCSVHCHIDFTKNTLEDVRKFFFLYALLEPSLYTVSDKERYSNIYCPGLSHATMQVVNAAGLLRNNAMLSQVGRYWNKYTGINLASLSRFGTIEIRTHSGTGEGDDLVRWVRILNFIKHAAVVMKEGDILAIRSPEELVANIFPPSLADIMLTDNLHTYWNSAKTNVAHFLALEQVMETDTVWSRNMPDRVLDTALLRTIFFG